VASEEPEQGRDGGGASVEADRADAAYARRLRDALAGLGMLGMLAQPQSAHQLLSLLVRNAMQVTGARVGTLRLLDKATNELVFEVIEGSNLPPRAVEAARAQRVHLGEGVAGLVAATGQAAVRSDLAADARFVAQATERIGFVPNSLLCLPLNGEDRILGVIELFDKTNGAKFTAADMATLGLFGEAAAVAIGQAQVLNDLTRLFAAMLERLLGDIPNAVLLQDRAADVVGRVIEASDYRDAIEIAVTAGQIARQGPEARRYCLQVLDAFGDYLRAQNRRATLGGRLS
jgi:putative methionine-R-sulfoxide reductase with GAF domain